VNGVLWTARQVSLYLVSLLAVATAEIAWQNVGPAALGAYAVGLAVAVVLGDLLEEALSGVANSVWRWRARLVGLGASLLGSFFVVLVAVSNARLAASAAHACALLQPALLVVAGLLGLHLAALGNALVLVILAALPGGPPAVLAVVAFLPAVGFFFAYDHTARRLQGRAVPSALVWMITVDAARLVLPGALAVLCVFTAFPPGRPAFLPDLDTLDRTAKPHVYEWLVLILCVTSGAMVAVSRLFRSDAPADKLLEDVLPRVEAEELIDPPAREATAYRGARERVIRAYVSVLARARQVGCELPPQLTAGEIEARLREGAPMRELTEAFADARYGPDEPSGANAVAAERLAAATAARLSERRRRKKR
jgi:hypothetical protein